MASDFGDECGEKLIDWFLEIGKEKGAPALLKSCAQLKTAFKNARAGASADDPSSAGSKGIDVQQAENAWAKLSMQEFQALPAYDSVKEIIDSSLKEVGIEHTFAAEGEHDFLVFKVADAPEVADCFHKLEKSTDAALDAAFEKKGLTREKLRDSTPLEARAEACREAARALAAERGHDHGAHVRQDVAEKRAEVLTK